MKIVTGAKVSEFKRMRFRNYCKFSCTSGSVCPGGGGAGGGRAWPRGSGDEVDCMRGKTGSDGFIPLCLILHVRFR